MSGQQPGGAALWEVISCFEWITNTRGGDKIWVNEPLKEHTTLPVTQFKVCIPQTMCGVQHPVAVQASHDAHHATPQWSGQRLITIDHKLGSQRFINTNIWMSSFWDRPALYIPPSGLGLRILWCVAFLGGLFFLAGGFFSRFLEERESLVTTGRSHHTQCHILLNLLNFHYN